MNVIWITSDTFRRDHIGAYGNKQIQTPSLDMLAAKSIRFQRHYAAGFPTMPARADYFTGRYSMSFMGWSPLPSNVITLAEILSQKGLHTSAVDVMPTVLEIFGFDIPDFVEGKSLLAKTNDSIVSGREFTVSSIPFANPGDPVRSVDNFLRMLKAPTVTTITSENYSLLYSPKKGQSKLYDLSMDPSQQKDIISDQLDVGKELHQFLVEFMRDTNVAEYLFKPRHKLYI
jgi:arylsulfatase A-like enzyme